MSQEGRSVRIAALNDRFRRSFSGGRIMITAAVEALPGEQRMKVLETVRNFTNFVKDNDPWREHDLGTFTIDGVRYLFKIDYYDPSMSVASEDPTDPTKTMRVLTIMTADEY